MNLHNSGKGWFLNTETSQYPNEYTYVVILSSQSSTLVMYSELAYYVQQACFQSDHCNITTLHLHRNTKIRYLTGSDHVSKILVNESIRYTCNVFLFPKSEAATNPGIMTSWRGNDFRIIGPLRRESTDDCHSPKGRLVIRSLGVSFAVGLNKLIGGGDLRRHYVHLTSLQWLKLFTQHVHKQIS